MRAFSDCNPVTIFTYYAAVVLLAVFCMNPVMIALSLAGSVLLFSVYGKGRGLSVHFLFFALFVVMSVINPLFYHDGVTVLFVLNDNPITLEALFYGAVSSAMIVSVLYWFRSFSDIMTGDRLLYLFGAASPKLALILSMTLRYIPLFVRQARRVSKAQKALGLNVSDNIPDSIRSGTRVFSIMTTWALENGIITADSMTARGYGTGRRTCFSLYGFYACDAAYLTVTVVLTAVTVAAYLYGSLDYVFYPSAMAVPTTSLALCAYVSYTALVFMPSLSEFCEDVKWKYLKSKI